MNLAQTEGRQCSGTQRSDKGDVQGPRGPEEEVSAGLQRQGWKSTSVHPVQLPSLQRKG